MRKNSSEGLILYMSIFFAVPAGKACEWEKSLSAEFRMEAKTNRKGAEVKILCYGRIAVCIIDHIYHYFPGEGDGTPLQYSCLENATDGGAW